MSESDVRRSGHLLAIWLKRFRRGPMDARRRARLVAGQGLVGNANQGGRRQVTIISAERWRAMMAELSADLDPSTRRANLLVDVVALANTRDRILRVGAARLRILGETRPCERMDEALPGLRGVMAKDWGGGVFAEILEDAEIAVGDVVRWD
jgi:MOSC domain-containing protein YiiM